MSSAGDAVEDPALAAALAERLSAVQARAVRITELRQASGGASRQTWFVRTPDRRAVLRRDPPQDPRPDVMAGEAAVLRAAARAGVPVPEVLDHGDDLDGASYLLTEHVDGETIPRKLLRDPEFARARGVLAHQLGRAAALVHRTPPPPGLPDGDPLEELERDYRQLDDPLPVVELALLRLREQRPSSTVRALVHGDLRNGNLIVGADGLRAVLDWELARVGDPMQDLGWLCTPAWRFGAEPAVGGFGDREQLFDGYAEIAGHRPDPRAVRWWELFGSTKWAVICRAQAQRHLSGEQRSAELAAIGRRVCEQEADLLTALDIPRPPGPEQRTAPADDLHGRPTASELTAAVADLLRDEAIPGTGGRLRYQLRVAANALDVVQRELDLGAHQRARCAERSADLGLADRAELAEAIRTGRLDTSRQDVRTALWEQVLDRLAVANPRHGGGSE